MELMASLFLIEAHLSRAFPFGDGHLGQAGAGAAHSRAMRAKICPNILRSRKRIGAIERLHGPRQSMKPMRTSTFSVTLKPRAANFSLARAEIVPATQRS